MGQCSVLLRICTVTLLFRMWCSWGQSGKQPQPLLSRTQCLYMKVAESIVASHAQSMDSTKPLCQQRALHVMSLRSMA